MYLFGEFISFQKALDGQNPFTTVFLFQSLFFCPCSLSRLVARTSKRIRDTIKAFPEKMKRTGFRTPPGLPSLFSGFPSCLVAHRHFLSLSVCSSIGKLWTELAVIRLQAVTVKEHATCRTLVALVPIVGAICGGATRGAQGRLDFFRRFGAI